MASYYRTQVLLEDWQHATLRSLAERHGMSVSDLVRRILTERLRPKKRKGKGLAAMAGIGRDRRARGRDHDRWLYGPDGSR